MKLVFDFRDRGDIIDLSGSFLVLVQINYTRGPGHLFILSFYFTFVF
ncbi:hypothetical protein HMPREF3213_02889 [Heyndrickxia coagulans]|jgi:hypothetical protein|uniref:Uncharacterized protein n=1 Tax=Heyndrickxia coagulans TaxID=1398 RepID=A0A133KGI5_HEYCO|nr:hypothetical protein HMPREF3213_02889 [Heyndrickxia coagulans]KYC73232.1 hypothetical protein B4099_1956 [Heyndrickxia coagulans]